MFTRTFNLRQFLRHTCGSQPLREYCRERGISFGQHGESADDDERRFASALFLLPTAQQEQIELELAQVNDMADAEGIAHLSEAAEDQNLPPDSVAGDTARALWFFLHHPQLFQQVFLQQEIREADAWRVARAPAGMAIENADVKRMALADALKSFFGRQQGFGRFCAVEAASLGASSCFLARLSDRLQLFDAFTDAGKLTTQAARPAVPLLFGYVPADGRILLKSRTRAEQRILALFRCFAETVLGVEINADALLPTFNLHLFKQPFHPLPDSPDMERVRVKALHLLYPARSGRRRVKLETLASDDPDAIWQLLLEHGGSPEVSEQLEICYAELQVTLRVSGGSKHYPIRLWPDRCSLNQTPLGLRLSACLQRWGLTHAA